MNAERFLPELFEFFRWTFAQILEDSPLLVAEREADDQFRTWLRLWPACSTVWIGEVYSSGKPEHRAQSDTLSRDEVGAVFGYLRRRLRYGLHCIVDTAGKSLHGWFDAPRNKVLENRLRAGLEVFGCDPKVFTYSQPVRVPGAWREGRRQRLVWLRE